MAYNQATKNEQLELKMDSIIATLQILTRNKNGDKEGRLGMETDGILSHQRSNQRR